LRSKGYDPVETTRRPPTQVGVKI